LDFGHKSPTLAAVKTKKIIRYMAFLEWDKNLSVGIDSIDEEHKQLIQMLNELYEHIGKKSNNEMISDLISGMKKYTLQHFATEENYFQQFNYPYYEEHKAEHDRFVEKAMDLEKRFNSGKLIVSFEITSFIKEWIREHILESDKKYTDFLLKNGVK
jgi:hemerythrin-like metal-binding protein